MADLVNLRQARKRRERAAARGAADANAAKHGRPGAERRRDAAEDARSVRAFEGHRRETPGAETGPSGGPGAPEAARDADD